MHKGCVIAIQDMGAAGLTSSATEMGAKGDLGVTLDLDKVPCREENMSAYEMMLSESQERMLMVLKPEKEKEAEAIFRKWGLDFAVIGETTANKRFIVRHHGDVMADLPIKELGDSAPEYKRPFVSAAKPSALDAEEVPAPVGLAEALEKLLATPDLCSKRWVWEQYDHIILGNTVQRPGGDAAVVRVGDGPKGLALTTDVTPRYCEADPFEGGKQAVAECWRNLTAVGARPLAITDNLNFGNPERPEIMGQFVGCVPRHRGGLQGAGVSRRVRQCLALQRDQWQSDPADAVDWRRRADRRFHQVRDARLQARGRGDPAGRRDHRLAWPVDVSARALRARGGRPPPVDLVEERENGDFVRALILDGVATAAHDLSDGGLLVALAEMAMASGIGAQLAAGPSDVPTHAHWFGEDQARYLVTVPMAKADLALGRARAASVPASLLGTTGGDALTLPGERRMLVKVLRERFEGWLPAYMAGAMP